MKTNGGFLVTKIKQLGDRIFEKILSEKNIDAFNGAQGRILYVLWQEDGISIRSLSVKCGLAITSLTTMLERMEHQGPVSYTHLRRAESGFEGVFMNRKRWPILCAIAIFAVAILVYANFQKKHTFVLANDEGMIKSEQIQPLFGTVKVSGDCDTDVVFTDMETGEKYVVGYITSGVSEKIKLEKGKWYTVAGGGNLVISPVNVRVE